MTQERKIDSIICSPDTPLKEALKILNKSKGQILLVVDQDNKLTGTVTDGDVRRSLLENFSLSKPISEVLHRNPTTLHRSDVKKAAEYMKQYGVKQIPVVNDSMEVVDLILWKEVISDTKPVAAKNIPVFIPAGGKGERLDPFTKILPKPLIPVGEKPIIEIIMERFSDYGFNQFIISLNYKADMIKSYFGDNQKFKIEYVNEDCELGTAGSLSLIKGKINDSLIISNCDVITDVNFEELLDYHKSKAFHATIVGSVRHVKIPYGVLEIEGGTLSSIVEKPEYDFIVNSGIYILEPDIVNLIPDGSRLDMPELLTRAQDKGLRIGVYPFSGEWIDIGQWEEYKKAVEHFRIWNL